MAGTANPIPSQLKRVFGPTVLPKASLQHAPASNTDAVVTVTADATRPNAVTQIFFSYDATPAGSIKIEDGSGNAVFGPFAITSAGLQIINFFPAFKGTKNTALIITLAAGGSGVTGVLGVNALLEGP